MLATGVTVITTLGIILALLFESIEFFKTVPILTFLTGNKWTPLFANPSYGVLPLIRGTLMIAVGSCLIAIPLGVTIAIYLSEYASPKAKKRIKPALELLAGVPTVVYGYFGLILVTPFLKNFIPGIGTFNALAGAIVVGIMILPLVASLSEDALSSVPRETREAAYALGASKAEVSYTVVLKSATSGIIASIILAFSRAIGETMAVTLASGSKPADGIDFTQSVQTMTAYIVQVSSGDVARGGPEYQSLFAVGLTLFLVTLVMNSISQAVVKRVGRHQ